MKMLHPIAGAIALLTILTFWISTVISEMTGSRDLIVAVKSAIPWGFLILIPAIALAGASGFNLANGRHGGLVDVKRKRMRWVAANGVLVLIPSALFLAMAAHEYPFDMRFYIVQTVELVAGAVNIVLIGLNLRDGLRMKGRRQQKNSLGSTIMR